MRGAPDVGQLRMECEVEPTRSGKFRGRLSIPYEGTRLTDEYPDKNDAQSALDALRAAAFPAANASGLSTKQEQDFKEALAA